MPLVSAALLGKLLLASSAGNVPVFAECGGTLGFPCLVPVAALAVIEAQRRDKRLAIGELALRMNAVTVRAPTSELANINTPEALADVERLLVYPKDGQ